MYKIILINFFIFIFLLFGIELFFTINDKEHWVSNDFTPPSYNIKNNKIETINSYQIDPELLKKSPWPYPDPDSPNLKNINLFDLDYSKKYGDSYFNVYQLEFGDGTGIVTSIKNSEFVLYKTKYNHHSDENKKNSYRLSSFIPKSPKFALHFGDSFIFGEGIPQDSTLTSQLNKGLPDYNHYNFGVPGNGPNDHYHLVEQGIDQRYRSVVEKKGLLIYHFIDFHIQRVKCSIRCFEKSQSYRLVKPEYKLEASKPILNFKHFIDNPKYFLFFSILSQSKTLAFFKFDIPREFKQDDYTLAISLVNSLFQAYKDYLTIDQKIIVIHPNSTNQSKIDMIKNASAQFGFRVIDYSNVDVKSILNDRDVIPIDTHPSPAYNALISQMLKKDLKVF